ncbi:hypothetical protein [Mesorhizobium sp. M0491]|uniref:hypothetical protein n=1 Tax=Mesorhizobium sp. M0491 TaxID=2956950 RepID=UPI00333BB1CE
MNQNQRWIHGDVQEGLQTVQDLNVEISNLAISSSKPVVTRFTPTYIAPASQSDDVLIEVEGFHLYDAESGHKPSLRLEAKEFNASGATENHLSFFIPRDSVPVFDHKLVYASFELTLFQNTSGWVVSFFYKKYEWMHYGLLFTILPEKLGEYFVATTATIDLLEKDFLTPKITVNAPSDGGHSNDPPHSYVPDMGYKFEVNTFSAVYDEHLGWYRGNRDDDTITANAS